MLKVPIFEPVCECGSKRGEAMIGLFKVKEKQREQAQNATRGGASVKKQSAGELRLHK
ncbi:unnamed protein product, partial [Microthlaspi erraticum]